MPDSELAGEMFLFTHTGTAPVDNSRPETALVDRIREGDETAFAELYRKFAPLVHGVVLARVPYDEAQDIVQDVFIAAYKNIGNLRESEKVGAWLASIARNLAVEYYRRSKPTDELTDDIRGVRDRRNEAAEVLSAIRCLPEAYRETLVLRLVEGMSGNEIAERTGMRPDSVRVNLHRGMDMLRKSLGITPGAKEAKE